MEKLVFLAFDPLTSERKSYIELAVRTAAPLSGRTNLLHSMLGVSGELLELYQALGAEHLERNAIVKEAGDVLWYYALFYDCYSAPSDDIFVDDWRNAVDTALDMKAPVDYMAMVTCSDKLIALIKKEMCYGTFAALTDVHELYRTALSLLAHLFKAHNIELVEVLDANIEKLSKRYVQGTFDKTAATTHNSQ